MKIIWNGTSLAQSRNEGYKISEDQIFNNLNIDGFEITRDCFVPSSLKSMLDAGIGLMYESEGKSDIHCDLLINNRLPSDYTKSSGHNVGFSYWETSRLPELWVQRMNTMNEIWTTSRWAKDVFANSGVSVPIYDFKLGVDAQLFHPVLRNRYKYQFTFLSIGSPSTRKNSQLVVDAFTKLFGKDERFKLIYKSIGSPDARVYNTSKQPSPVHNYPNIEVIEDDVSMEELSKIYDRSDCLVYPTSGEGWGMIPFQAIAKGIPTICTNATACTEYAHLSVPLDFKWGTHKMSGIYEGCGEWAEPNFDDLCDKMLYVVNNYDEVANTTYLNATEHFPEWSWKRVVEGYSQRLCQILKN